MQAPTKATAAAKGATRPARRQAAIHRIGTSGYMQKRCSQQRWQGGKCATSEKYRLPARQTVATVAARASAWGATASAACRPSRCSAGENRPPIHSPRAVTVASSATTASRARNSETWSTDNRSALQGGQRVGGVDGPVGGERPAEGGGGRRAAAGGQGGHGVEHRHHLPEGAGRREVLLLVGHVDLLDAGPGGEPGDHRLHDVL